jgi:hypothetical protein
MSSSASLLSLICFFRTKPHVLPVWLGRSGSAVQGNRFEIFGGHISLWAVLGIPLAGFMGRGQAFRPTDSFYARLRTK